MVLKTRNFAEFVKTTTNMYTNAFITYNTTKARYWLQ